VLPTFLLAEAAREDVKVILSGEGADELFGGYPTYLGHKFAERWQRVPDPLRRAARWAADRWPSSTGKMTLEYMLKQFLAAGEQPWLERHLTWLGAMAIEDGVVAELAGKLDRFPHEDSLNRVMWFDFLTYLPDDLLVKVDRATMLASVEARAPFLDREVMELVLPGPSRFKVRGLTTKAILKEAARGLVPDAVINRRKRGLSVPVARWLNTGLAPLADRLLDTPLLAEHRTGRRNHARRLWPQLMLALWSERWGVNIK
jgi:asparagine synthase (glutamine-hydrolysing)